MNISAAYDIANDGCAVSTVARLLWDEDEPFAKRPFRVDSFVGGIQLATSHHETATEAKQNAAKMHAAYLEAHSTITEDDAPQA